MTPTLRVALYGFSDFEHRALGSFFRLAARPALALEQVRDLAAAQVIVADADVPGVIDHLQALARTADTVFVGSHAPARAAAHLTRPIDALHVLREIDTLASRRDAPPQATGSAPATPQAVPHGAAPRRSARSNALLVDDSAIALRYLQLRLERLGVHTDLAQGSARALELLAQRAYGFVFLDVELGEASALDGLALCQHIKRAHRHVEGRPPSLVLVSAHHSEIDRARGAFAGCDHYLAKPVDDEALRVVLSQRPPRAAPRSERS